jgi:hypothetical protein
MTILNYLAIFSLFLVGIRSLDSSPVGMLSRRMAVALVLLMLYGIYLNGAR